MDRVARQGASRRVSADVIGDDLVPIDDVDGTVGRGNLAYFIVQLVGFGRDRTPPQRDHMSIDVDEVDAIGPLEESEHGVQIGLRLSERYRTQHVVRAEIDDDLARFRRGEELATAEDDE